MGEQIVLAQERYLRTGKGAPLRSMVEEFATQRRRIKKASILSVAHDLPAKKQREGTALPGVVIITDYRALVQVLGGFGSQGVGRAVLLATSLQKTEGMRPEV
ncbi:hypothetical protein PoB_006012600 [Plakobranchus ocellatus]|uniref:Uncharacterized protein n=1 Tax=Plakobranchus ocellatus TaxID=259542 RepID=A0AAV4CP08_9GAST|nr:hypothetical protein PoB_006012600 [Plakobranchus ocellatus]